MPRTVRQIEDPLGYSSYLIRVWPRHVEGRTDCTVTLESVATGHRTTLHSLDELPIFFRSQLGIGPPLNESERHESDRGQDRKA